MDNWKTILTFTYPHEAHIAKGYLESQGIGALIQDELTAQVNNFYSGAIGGVKILVAEKDYEAALKILQKGGYICEGKTQETREIETCFIYSKAEKNRCPYCGSENIKEAKEPNLFSVVLVLFIYAYLPFFRRYYHCFDCRKQWKFRMKK